MRLDSMASLLIVAVGQHQLACDIVYGFPPPTRGRHIFASHLVV